jgi:response regulator RpfG family c-di-GMP phosphodiesterase
VFLLRINITNGSMARATPSGLRGKEVSIHSRIVGIVDVFDALTSTHK